MSLLALTASLGRIFAGRGACNGEAHAKKDAQACARDECGVICGAFESERFIPQHIGKLVTSPFYIGQVPSDVGAISGLIDGRNYARISVDSKHPVERMISVADREKLLRGIIRQRIVKERVSATFFNLNYPRRRNGNSPVQRATKTSSFAAEVNVLPI